MVSIALPWLLSSIVACSDDAAPPRPTLDAGSDAGRPPSPDAGTRDGGFDAYVRPDATVEFTQRYTSVRVGMVSTCAIGEGGQAFCWGANGHGEDGEGRATFSRELPVAVAAVPDAIEVAAGYGHACALRSDGTVACWGKNEVGELGDGTTTDSTSPVAVAGLTGVRTIAAAFEATCAADASGVHCWGSDTIRGPFDAVDEVCGPARSPRPCRRSPTRVEGTVDSTAISMGQNHGCALAADATVRCWGFNSNGVLGDGTTERRESAVRVMGLDAVTALAGGGEHTCALTGGQVWCWGNNFFGQLGDGTNTLRTTPVQVAGLADAIAIGAGSNHSCAVRASGDVVCWGHNESGALGDGTFVNRSRPSPARTPLAVAALSRGGGTHTCGLSAGGALFCWGANTHGQLGIGRFEPEASVAAMVVAEPHVPADGGRCGDACASHAECVARCPMDLTVGPLCCSPTGECAYYPDPSFDTCPF